MNMVRHAITKGKKTQTQFIIERILKMKKVKRFFMMAMAVLACTAPAIAQEEEKVETTVAADVVNQYIWRGLDLGNVSLQPTLGVAYK